MPPWSLYVRFWGQSEKHRLPLSFSAFDPRRKWRLFTMSATAAGNDAAVCSCRRSLHDIQCSAKHHLNCDVETDGQTNVSNPSMILQKARNEGSGHCHHRNRKPQAENHDDWMLACGPCDGQDIVERHGNVSHDNLPTRLDECFAGLVFAICSCD